MVSSSFISFNKVLPHRNFPCYSFVPIWPLIWATGNLHIEFQSIHTSKDFRWMSSGRMSSKASVKRSVSMLEGHHTIKQCSLSRFLRLGGLPFYPELCTMHLADVQDHRTCRPVPTNGLTVLRHHSNHHQFVDISVPASILVPAIIQPMLIEDSTTSRRDRTGFILTLLKLRRISLYWLTCHKALSINL